jgi:hypothetical protein
MSDLRKGAFYWARVRPNEHLPESEWQPVRYTGKSADTHAREETRGDEILIVGYSTDTWDFIGLRSEDGHHFAEVVEVGEEIVR